MADQDHQQPSSSSPSTSASEPRRGLSLSVSGQRSPIQPSPPPPSQQQAGGLSPSRSARSKPILSPAGRPCVICMDRLSDGVECELGHFVCRGCLRGFIANLEPLQIKRNGGCIGCPGLGSDGHEACEAAPWSYEDLADLLDAKTQRVYVSRLSSVLASVLSSASLAGGTADPRGSMSGATHHRRRSSQRWSLGRAGTRGMSLAAASMASLAPGDEPTEVLEEELRWHRQVIDETILTLTCPRETCRKAFLDFDGCFALTCPGCGCGFCAACVVDCGDDAHEHCVRIHHGWYGTLEAFTAHHKVRRLASVAAYLRNILLPPASEPFSSSAPAPAASPVLPPRTPEQAAALVEALLTGPLAKDLEEVGIAVEDVRRALAGTKDAAGVAAVPKLFGAGAAAVAAVDAGPVAVVEHLRLHYSHEAAAAAHQHYRRILDGPFGYAPENDALSRWLGSCLTASSMLAAVWWLTAGTAEESGFPPLLAALVVGPAGLLLGTGRGLVVLQSLYVTLLAGLVCVPLYHWGYEIISRFLYAFVKIGGVLLHALGFAADATMEGLRILRGKHALYTHAAEGVQRLKRALDVVGLLPPEDPLAMPTATA